MRNLENVKLYVKFFVSRIWLQNDMSHAPTAIPLARLLKPPHASAPQVRTDHAGASAAVAVAAAEVPGDASIVDRLFG